MNAFLSAFVEEFRGRSGAGPYAGKSNSIGGRSPSLKWPHLFDLLVAKGYDQSAAAAISNSRVWARKDGALGGLPWNKAKDPKALKGVLKKYQKKHGVKASAAEEFVNHNHTPGRGHANASVGGSNWHWNVSTSGGGKDPHLFIKSSPAYTRKYYKGKRRSTLGIQHPMYMPEWEFVNHNHTPAK